MQVRDRSTMRELSAIDDRRVCGMSVVHHADAGGEVVAKSPEECAVLQAVRAKPAASVPHALTRQAETTPEVVAPRPSHAAVPRSAEVSTAAHG